MEDRLKSRKMKVKICGINKVEFAKWACEAGSDYLGLLIGITHIAEDKLTVEQAREIIEKSEVDRKKFVMVTHLLDAEEIIAILKDLKITTVQLHDAIAVKEIEKIRRALPELYIIKAIHVFDDATIDEALKMEQFADAIILDSRTKTRLGGTGNIHDWNISAEICKRCKKPVFLAGGLTPNNVNEAIEKVKPYAVDVNSGVEFEDGNKDFQKILMFIQNAKKA